METLAPTPATVEARPPAWFAGTVVDQDGRISYVAIDGRVEEAAQAVSCLVAPAVGDQVCAFRTAAGELFVTHVLSRQAEGPLRVEAPAGLSFSSPGRISVQAGEVEIEGERLVARFDEANWFVRLLKATGVEFALHGTVARLFAHAVETVAGRLQLSADRSYRHIREAEHIRTGVLDVRAETVAQIRARHTIVGAKELVKMDGSQIHVG